MVNDYLVTAIRNAIDRGETLDHAITTLINSGYNPKEIDDSLVFFGGTSRAISSLSKQVTQSQEEHFSQSPTISPSLTMSSKEQVPQVIEKKPESNIKPIFENKQINDKSPVLSNDDLPPPPKKLPQEPLMINQNNSEPKENGVQFVSNPLPTNKYNTLESTLNTIHPPRRDWTKEIILFILLIILLGLLAMTVIFRDSILSIFTG